MGNIFRNASVAPKARYTPKIRKTEESIQRQVCSYLRIQYPSVIFRSDYASGLHLTENQGRIHKSLQSSRAWPDLFIYEPREIVIDKDGNKRHYCGLALELKAEGKPVILKIGERKGHLSSDRHIQEQAVMLKSLIRKGYYANFAVGFDAAVKIIDWYMGRPANGQLF